MTVGSHHVCEALRRRYPANEYAVAFEVSNSTGYGASRRADALALSLWPSRGLKLLGFEVKVSRSDWQRELKAPAKAEAFFAQCDEWWLVTTPGIVKPGELPERWGLMELQEDGKLKVKTAAAPLTPAPLDRAFMASFLRAVTDQAQAFVDRHLDGAARVLADERVQAAEKQVANWRQRAEEDRRAHDQFRAEVGRELGLNPLRVAPASVERVLRAANAVQDLQQRQGLSGIKRQLRDALNAVEMAELELAGAFEGKS